MCENELNLWKMKILLVDDTPANIDVLRKTLEPEGYELSFAPNGKIALNVVNRVSPDLILLDVMMPDMDGFETCRRLKANEATQNIPIIFITAKIETEDIVEGLNLGGVDYIAKPFRQEEVCARVKTHLQLMASRKKLQKQNLELHELNHLKNQFVGMAAHDIRNPLSSMLGFSELLGNETYKLSAEEKKTYINLIHNSSKKLLALVNNLLDIAVIESGELRLNIIPNSISKLAAECVSIFEPQARKKNITIHSSFTSSHDALFDMNQISQVFDNLISNAIKFSPTDSNIYFSTRDKEGCCEVSVKDDGPGISLEDQEKLFGTFQKLSAKPTASEKSTGLGLAIVKKIITAHKSSIKVDSSPGSGATFSFSLPLAESK